MRVLVLSTLTAVAAMLFGCSDVELGKNSKGINTDDNVNPPSGECTLIGGEHALNLAVGIDTDEELYVKVQSTEVETLCRFVPSRSAGPWLECDTVRGTAIPSGWDVTKLALAGEARSGSLPALPTEVIVEVTSLGGWYSVYETFNPQYSDSYPNGERCDPEPFRTATITINTPPSVCETKVCGTDCTFERPDSTGPDQFSCNAQGLCVASSEDLGCDF